MHINAAPLLKHHLIFWGVEGKTGVHGNDDSCASGLSFLDGRWFRFLRQVFRWCSRKVKMTVCSSFFDFAGSVCPVKSKLYITHWFLKKGNHHRIHWPYFKFQSSRSWMSFHLVLCLKPNQTECDCNRRDSNWFIYGQMQHYLRILTWSPLDPKVTE